MLYAEVFCVFFSVMCHQQLTAQTLSNFIWVILNELETKDVSVLAPFMRESLLQELILFLMSHFCTFPWKCTGHSNHKPTCKIFIALTEYSGVFEPSDSSFLFPFLSHLFSLE